ncbi:TBC1 domain family member 5 isoform X1 [Latimeria chalumnae]|uniref:TBC1 domain family member 5 isoform X1 n=1 Tax=Latimeria chalumnae TaxID=7897 RepID=UPI00313ADF8D
MYSVAEESRHPLQEENPETGIDPLQAYKTNSEGGSNENRSAKGDSDGKFGSYRKEWEELFENYNYMAGIRQGGINGQLRSSRFRSVCWKLYLNVLPEDKRQWINKTVELRMWYKQIKETHITNPRKAAGQQDLVVNNPLSQDEGSLWNKFFQDKELRAMIEQDVTRTFPEMQYFQEEDVRNILTDILFCFARENEQLLYKQGMHELLAPIVFILHCDHQTFLHASETANPSAEMKALLNPEYLEHDAYAIFSRLMETAEPWFSTFEGDVQKEKDTRVTSIPFARPQDTGPSIAIVTKVNQIQDQLLKKNDIELYLHLNRLEIAPQIYGIRWVRLLFGREFPLQDLLVVWDALFADSSTLDLVDYIFVAMLLYIRDMLIASNYQTCLGLLLHYPNVGDVHSLIHKALFLRDPKNNSRPVNYQFQQNFDYYRARGADLMNKTRASAKSAPLNINKVSSSLLNLGRKLITPAISVGSGGSGPVASSITSGAMGVAPSSVAAGASAEIPQQQQHRMMKSESMPVQLSKGHSSTQVSSSPSVESLPAGRDPTASPPLLANKKDYFFSTISRSRSHSKTMGKKESEEELEAQISFLQGQLNDLEAMCKYCAKMMNVHLENIQDVILKEKLKKEDDVLISLAGLKQIKDILKGSLHFNQSQLESEDNEEITIADDHYCSASNTEGEKLEQRDTEKETETTLKKQQAASETSLNSDSKNSDDYILLSKEVDEAEQELPKKLGNASDISELPQASQVQKAALKQDAQSIRSPVFTDPLMGGVSASSSNYSSSPDDDSSNSKDSDFTIVNPLDI